MSGRSVLVMDNFSAHVSPESVSTIETELKSALHLLPPNTTSACQPLDVGVMGPFKAKLRAKWLRDKNTYDNPADRRRAVIKRAIDAWNEITPELVEKACSKAIPKPSQ